MKSIDQQTASKTGAIEQNNLLFNRETVARELIQGVNSRKRIRKVEAKNSKNQGNSQDGFVYAILADGSLLGEQTWLENRDKEESCLIPPQQLANNSQMVWSLQNLQLELGVSRNRHLQRQMLPPAPVSKPKDVVPLYKSEDTSALTPPNFSSGAPSPMKSIPACVEPSHSKNSINKSTLAFNPYNKSSAHISNCSPPVLGPSSFQAQKANDGQHVHWQQQRCQKEHPPEDEFDDELDDFVANVDEDALVFQTASKLPQKPCPRRVTSDNFPVISDIDRPLNSTSFDYGDSAPYVGPSSYHDNPRYNAVQNGSFRNNNSFSAPLCPDHGLPCIILTSKSSKNPGRQFYRCCMRATEQQCSFFQWMDDDAGGSGGSLNNSSENQQSSFSKKSPSSYGADSCAYGDTRGSSRGAPLCQHNLQGQLLTSKTGSNPGRQFYKCSLPHQHEQCDFFEWADGDDKETNSSTNWAQATTPGAPPPRPLTLCKDIHSELQRVFGHKRFRKGQQGIIEQAVSGRDVFVLMPTGGGKSLCYQLPAVCCPGLSVVISPLLSLVQDQVQNLTKAGVTSVFLNSSQDFETEQRDITRRLNAQSAGGIKLLYLTPEKLRHSNIIQQILMRLYHDNLLSRFVIDEAHCLSDWGHDFRPDYSALNLLRECYPKVPLMALTATANEKVVNDAVHALKMRDCFHYKTSFNRPNLHYEVCKKDSKSEDSICDYIVEQHQNNNQGCSGVIYCLSRKDCEKLSERIQEKLNKRGMYSIRVSFYHAELDAGERERRHLQWSNGTLSVLCATIAFGMGIDKPDVRFVIHYSMPKSITHYYQESGRAGRDGEKADCILYYSYKDKQVLEGMIRKSSTNPFGQSTRRKIDQLYACLRYCEDEFRCRRTLQLEHFGESFNRSKCRGTCDNCREGRESEKRDMTEVAQALLKLLASIQAQKKNGMGVTLLQLTEIFRGSKSKATTKFLNVSRLEGYNDASRFKLKKKQDIDRVAHAMIFEHIIVEQSEQNKQGFASDYVQEGDHALATRNGSRRFFVEFPKLLGKGKENVMFSQSSTKKRKNSPAPKKKAGRKGSSAPDTSGPSYEPESAAASHEVYSLLSDDDNSGDDESAAASESAMPAAVLEPALALKLQKRIKKVLLMWAEEEQMMGIQTYYWHIMSNKMLKTVSSQCPTTLEELKALDGLGEKRFKEYGERLIKNIQNFVQTENLEQLLERKKSSRPSKTRKVAGSGVRETHQTDSSHGAPPNRSEDHDAADEFPLDFDESDLLNME